MKRISLYLLSAAALFAAGCSDNDVEVHQTFFYPQRPQGMIVYADQPSDTTRLFSLDSWTLRSSAPEWFTCTPDAFDVPPGYSSATLITANFQPNTTGEVRSGQIQVDNFDKIGMQVTQYSWLNVIMPAGAMLPTSNAGADTQQNTEYQFEMRLKANSADTIVVFRTYRPNATISSNAEWAQPDQTSFAAARRDTVRIALQPNQTGADRTATLTLTSAGVSTPIRLVQPTR